MHADDTPPLARQQGQQPAMPPCPPSPLYPAIDATQHGLLDVGDGHRVYWERSGNPQGIPAVFLHGGPGAGCSPTSRRFFNPERYHIVCFDQRGCGRSEPFLATQANTTSHLVADIERLRAHLGVDRWLVFGGSWGSTLALAYAQAHPERCLALVLRGVWLGSAEEIDWWLYGMRQFFPKAWEAFAAHVAPEEQGDLLAAYCRRMEGSDAALRDAAAQAWALYEGACAFHNPRPADRGPEADRANLGMGVLEAHYFAHQAFLAPQQLLEGMPRIAHLPGAIVQGRYDVICPNRYALSVADRWPGVRLTLVGDAGHASIEPGIAKALVQATDDYAATGRLG